MLKKIVLVVAGLILALLAFAATRPDTFSVQRSIAVKAAPEKLYTQIDDFHRWGAWSPWEKLDPAMKRTFSGAESGKGAAYAWAGNSEVGSGRMEIMEVAPAARILIKLDFIEPFEGHNTAEFTLVPKGDTTTVTWVMAGPAPFISKLMGVFFNMDSMIGKDFETGLANLKAVAEK